MFSFVRKDTFLLSHVHTFVKNMHHQHRCNCCHLPVFHSLHVYFSGSWCWGEEKKCNCQRACNHLFFCECEQQHPLLKTILQIASSGYLKSQIDRQGLGNPPFLRREWDWNEGRRQRLLWPSLFWDWTSQFHQQQNAACMIGLIIRHSHILALRDRHIHAKHRILLHAFILHKNATTVSYQMLNAECHNVLWGALNCIILLSRGLSMHCF